VHLAALRRLAVELGADARIAEVRAERVPRGQPRALTLEQLERLLAMPDLRTTRGERDYAALRLLADAGLRRFELSALTFDDVDEHPRLADPRLRDAIRDSTRWAVRVRRAKRGRSRTVPRTAEALAALIAWRDARPRCAHEQLFVSLPRTGRAPAPLGPRDVGRLVERYATAAGLPDDRRSPHTLRHTFCTLLAATGAQAAVIRELAGHADMRTTSLYTDVDPGQLQAAIGQLAAGRRGLLRAAR
jgi:integrase/recombinase XerD